MGSLGGCRVTEGAVGSLWGCRVLERTDRGFFPMGADFRVLGGLRCPARGWGLLGAAQGSDSPVSLPSTRLRMW